MLRLQSNRALGWWAVKAHDSGARRVETAFAGAETARLQPFFGKFPLPQGRYLFGQSISAYPQQNPQRYQQVIPKKFSCCSAIFLPERHGIVKLNSPQEIARSGAGRTGRTGPKRSETSLRAWVATWRFGGLTGGRPLGVGRIGKCGWCGVVGHSRMQQASCGHFRVIVAVSTFIRRAEWWWVLGPAANRVGMAARPDRVGKASGMCLRARCKDRV